MADCRLPTMPFEIDGRTFVLRCNMNVLADVEQLHNGSLMEALEQPGVLTTSKEFLSAMLNDYAEEQGWDVRYTPRSVGRLLPPSPAYVNRMREIITDLVLRSVTSGSSGASAQDQEEPEKNGMTTQS